MQSYGDKLHLFVDECLDAFAGQIEAILRAAGVQHGGVREIEVRMEEAFISLVRQHTSSVQQGKAMVEGR